MTVRPYPVAHTVVAPLAVALAVGLAASAALVLGAAGCDSPSSDPESPAPQAAAPTPPPAPSPAAPVEPRAPEVIIDRSDVSIDNQHVATGEPSLVDKASALLAGKAGVEGHPVDLVAMRNAKPSQVVALVGVLRAAHATSANVKTQARDDTTQKLPVSFASSLPDCSVVAWIAKDGVIDVWPAGGGATKRVSRGLAGPDMTLGTDAIRAQGSGCSSPAVAVGGEDTMTWGLVFDLATSALTAPGARASSVVLLTNAAPGRKLDRVQ
jgi:hypothetical protein